MVWKVAEGENVSIKKLGDDRLEEVFAGSLRKVPEYDFGDIFRYWKMFSHTLTDSPHIFIGVTSGRLQVSPALSHYLYASFPQLSRLVIN